MGVVVIAVLWVHVVEVTFVPEGEHELAAHAGNAITPIPAKSSALTKKRC